jgi:hypothetical protein
MIEPSVFLRRVLQLDAAFAAMTLPLVFASDFAGSLLNLPATLLLEASLFLIVYAAFVGWLSLRTAIPKPLLLLVIIINGAWAIASILLLFSNAVAPNLLGQLVVAAQGIAVGVFAELQYIGMRKATPPQTA